MSLLARAQMKRLIAVHGWCGALLGLLLYTIVATGTVVVFAQEIATWSVGGADSRPPLPQRLDGKVRSYAEAVTKGYREDIGVWMDQSGDLRIFPHTHARNPGSGEMDDLGTMFRVAASTGELVERHDGFIWRMPEAWEPSALRRFLVDLHVQLYAPAPWGLVLTGILGLAVMAAGVTGFLMHRHLLRDLFVAARPGGRLVAARDRHVLAASWGLPFAFLLAFTGSFFSFAGSIGMPMLAYIAFGGDGEAMNAALHEPAVTPDAASAEPADLDAIVARSTGRARAPAIFIDIQHYGRADGRVVVWHDPPEGRLGFVQNLFDGADGAFLEARPAIGRAPSAAATLYGLMGPLHFGNFAGVLSKAVWGGLGAAMAFVVVSGLRLWLRRREAERYWRGFARAVTATAWGLPIAMLASAYACFLALPFGDPFRWTPLGFLSGAVLCIAAALRPMSEPQLELLYRRILGAACLALPVLRMACGGPGWAEALARGSGAVLSVDLLLLTGGAVLLWWRERQRVAVPPGPARLPEAAE